VEVRLRICVLLYQGFVSVMRVWGELRARASRIRSGEAGSRDGWSGQPKAAAGTIGLVSVTTLSEPDGWL